MKSCMQYKFMSHKHKCDHIEVRDTEIPTVNDLKTVVLQFNKSVVTPNTMV